MKDSRPQSHGPLECLSLALLALFLAPLSLVRVLCVILFNQLSLQQSRFQPSIPIERGKRARRYKGTALVNGGRMQKALYVVRALARQGYRVVLIEERGWGELCPARFSNAVDQFFLIPSGGGYINATVDIAVSQNVDLFVPCSGIATTGEDAEVAQILRKSLSNSVRTIIQNVDLVETLHEKPLFVELVNQLNLDAPSTHLVTNPDAALDLLRQQDRTTRLLFKAAYFLDDVGRWDLSTYPLLSSSTDVPDWKQTEDRLRHGLPIPISEETPYIAQEFIGGPGVSEWCSHATVIDGEIQAFVCCPSNNMLMTYHDATCTPIGKRALEFTTAFLDRLATHPKWQGTRLTGQFSFDFIHEPSKDRLVVIECNPRVHTAIVCFKGQENELGAALDGSRSVHEEGFLFPTKGKSPVSWDGHDLVIRTFPFLLSLLRWLNPSGSPTSSNDENSFQYNLEAVGCDGAWATDDLWPWFALWHLHWPYLLIQQAVVRRKSVSHLNVSTSRIFEC